MSRGTPGPLLVLVLALAPLRNLCAASPADDLLTAAAAGRGLICVSPQDQATSWLADPALLGESDATVLSVQHVRWYGLPELTGETVGFLFPSVPLALIGTHFGEKLYRETGIALATAWQSGDLRAGVALHLGQIAIARYGCHHGGALDLALAYDFTPDLAVNVRGRNVLAWGNPDWTGSMARSLAVSLTAKLSTRAAVATEIFKDPLYPAESRVGLEWKLFRALLLRAGVTVGPARTTLGLRLSLRGLLFDYAFVHHSVLGGTHFVGLTLLRSHSRAQTTGPGR